MTVGVNCLPDNATDGVLSGMHKHHINASSNVALKGDLFTAGGLDF